MLFAQDNECLLRSPVQECVWEPGHFHPLNKIGVVIWVEVVVVLNWFKSSI